jgi:methylated-DNA-[protein]-cysteine S-methyltransferase
MHTTIDTPAGPFTILARGGTVLAAGFTRQPEQLLALVPGEETAADADLDTIAKAVTAYFDGDLTAIDAVPVEQRSGPYIEQAWRVLRDIPAGEPISYQEFARRTGRPAAIRAAAQACARNAAALFVPCHRVVRTDGGMGGYRWRTDVKVRLLAHEASNTENR